MKINIQIIFEDNHLLVVSKPPNVLSQKDRTGDADMLTILKNEIKIRDNKPGNVFLGLVHRLDRPVGGVMAFAKTSKCAARLSDQIRKKVFTKTYLAVIHGKPAKRKDTLINYLLKNHTSNTVSVVDNWVKGAKKAMMDYEIVDEADGFSLVKVFLYTGRPHQIRVQLSSIGHPLYGDQRYGFKVNKKGQQIALWSHSITCEHPTFRKKITFTSFPKNEHPWNNFNLTLEQNFTDLSDEWSPEEKDDLAALMK
jgi:23S rRNA pseudouridine1911/1915/1917 synthase